MSEATGKALSTTGSKLGDFKKETREESKATGKALSTTGSKGYGTWVAAVFVLVLTALSFHEALDQFALNGVKETTTESFAIYGSARVINAAISVFQTSQVNVPFIGSIQLGEQLDPVNDAIERLSSVMVWAIGSLMLQRIVLEFASSMLFKWGFLAIGLLAVTGLLMAEWSRARKPIEGGRSRSISWINLYGLRDLLVRIFIIATIVRFIVPVFVAGSLLASQAMLGPEFDKHRKELEVLETQVTQVTDDIEAQRLEAQRIEETQRLEETQRIEETHRTEEARRIEEAQRTEEARRLEILEAQRNEKESELSRLREELSTLQREYDNLDKEIGEDAGWRGTLPKWIPGSVSPGEKLVDLKRRREETKEEIEKIKEGIKNTKQEKECFESQLSGEECSWLKSISSASKAGLEAVSKAGTVGLEAMSKASKAGLETLSNASTAGWRTLSNASMAGYARIKNVVDKASDLPASITQILVASAIKSILFPIVFLAIAVKGCLPVVRQMSRLSLGLVRDSRELRDALSRPD